jgi:hypothetical protein
MFLSSNRGLLQKIRVFIYIALLYPPLSGADASLVNKRPERQVERSRYAESMSGGRER